jgi:propionate CoA-transferase
VTERCVFRLVDGGLELIEVAPGVDLERDILAQMDFEPLVRDVRPMDPMIFRPEPMDLRARMLALPLEQRFSYDAEQNLFFVNFERMSVSSPQDVGQIRAEVEKRLGPLGHKVYAIVNYDNFDLAPAAVDAYAAMVKHLVEHYYVDVTRYTTSGFLRMKLGDALRERGVAPHIYESGDEARGHLHDADLGSPS